MMKLFRINAADLVPRPIPHPQFRNEMDAGRWVYDQYQKHGVNEEHTAFLILDGDVLKYYVSAPGGFSWEIA